MNKQILCSWFKIDILKLTWVRKGFEKGRCPLCGQKEDALHILLKCSKTRKWMEQFLSRKWFTVNEEVAYKRTINCTNAVELKHTEKYLHKIRCKLGNKISNI
jgi:hypothetical protein